MKLSVLLVSLLASTVLHPSWGASPSPDSRLANLATRAPAGTGENAMIAGFVIAGSTPKDMLIRAVGPTLAQSQITGVLTQPRLQVFDQAGKLLASNSQWPQALASDFKTVGASSLITSSTDAALRVKLAPGSYTAQVDGLAQSKGIARVEIYEMDTTSRLLNVSTRANISAGTGMMVSSLKIAGVSRRMLIRAAGPALTKLGVKQILPNPMIYVRNSSGTIIVSNDNWDSGNNLKTMNDAVSAAGAVPFAAGSKDAAAVVELKPGTYTIEVRGISTAAGVVMLEAADVTPGVNATSPAPASPQLPATPDTPPPSARPSYAAAALSWSLSDLGARLGPTFAQLNPLAVDDRPTLFKTTPKTVAGYYVRITPYDVGTVPSFDNDYWSDSGQVAYVPDDAANVGLDRIQTFAYYNHVWATSPRLDLASGKPSPDPQVYEANYTQLNGVKPTRPVAFARSYGMQQNEAIVLFREGLLAVAGTQTSRAGNERPYPGFKFPASKAPRAVAITTNNEFALVLVWDKDQHKSQLAVVALEGKYLAFHTWPYIALPNQGSFSTFKLLGYVDLPMNSANAISAASNGWWNGPSATAGKVLSQIDLGKDSDRKNVYNGAWNAMVAKNGYALISSTDENKAVIVDLTPLFSYIRESYLSSAASFTATMAARGPAPTQFPQTFDANPAAKPTVIWEKAFTKPTAVLAGQMLDRWTKDRFKAYVATADGTISIIDTSPLMWRNAWETKGTLQVMGTFQVGRNPVSLTFARHAEKGLPLIPSTSLADRLNNMLYVACRGDREIDGVVSFGSKGAVFRRIRDKRMGDPVAVSVAIRGYIITVADYAGKKLLSFRVGPLVDPDDSKKVFGCGPTGTDDFEFSGELPLPGSPFLVNSTNVN